MHSSLRWFILIIGTILLLTSCDNQVTEPEKEPPSETTFIPFDRNNSKHNTLSGAPSEFGCTLSTLNKGNADKNYRYQSFYIKFPGSIMKEAKGKTKYVNLILTSERINNRTPEYEGIKGVARVLNCNIPDTPQTLDILQEEIQKFDDQSWVSDFGSKKKTSGNNNTISEWVEECKYVPTGGKITYNIGQPNEVVVYFYRKECTLVFKYGV